VTTTTYTSVDGLDESSEELDSNGNRTGSSETDRTSISDSEELIDALRLKEVELFVVQQQLRQQDARYQTLEEKFETQRKTRLNDKAKVDEWAEQYQEIDACCENLEQRRATLEAELSATKKRHQVQLQAKERQLSELKDDQDCAVAVLQNAHKRELAGKDAEIKKARECCEEQEKALNGTIAHIAAQRDEVAIKAEKKQQETWEAGRIKLDAVAAEKYALKAKYDQTVANHEDATDENEKTIVSLKSHNQQMELEYQAMAVMVQQQFPNATELERSLTGTRTVWKRISGSATPKNA
jgi:chromosome segregation ATPase